LSGSLSHRKNAQKDSEALYESIVARLLPCKSGIVERELLVTTVLGVLERFDKAAATHYKAHHPIGE